MIALLLLILVAAGVAVHNARDYFRPVPKQGDAEVESGPAMPDDFGSEDAELKIEACVGHCITFVAVGIAKAVEAWPDKVRAEFYAYESEAGQKFVEEHGEELACIFLNGENRFTIERDGKQKDVHLAGPPSGEWDMADLAAVIKQQWLKVYGELPEGFDAKLGLLTEDDPPGDE